MMYFSKLIRLVKELQRNYMQWRRPGARNILARVNKNYRVWSKKNSCNSAKKQKQKMYCSYFFFL